MNFSLQMLAVLHTIYEFRLLPPGAETSMFSGIETTSRLTVSPDGWNPGDRRKLNESAVQKRAQKHLPPDFTVTRQSWNGCKGATKGKKIIWYGIKCAIEGLDPLPQHLEIEEEIISFGGGEVLGEANKRLREEIKKNKADISRLKDGRKEFENNFKNRAYTLQFIDGELLSELEDYKKIYEEAHLKLANEEKLRQKLDFENKKLRSEVNDLNEKTQNIGVTKQSEAKCFPPINLSPKIENISRDSENLMHEYYQLRDNAWDTLVTQARGKTPDYIFFVFHNFNIDIESFIETQLKAILPAMSINYVFACHQQHQARRKRMFLVASDLCRRQVFVHYIIGAPPPSNVTNIKPNNRHVIEDLHKQISIDLNSCRPKIDPFNPVREGFHQAWIVRTGNNAQSQTC